MEDVRDISAELHRLADAEPIEPIDTTRLLDRGHRGRRRRTLLGVGGAIACVAAIAVGASLLPAGAKPQVANDSQFTPVPGVPRGEDGAGQLITRAEAVRRCSLKYPNESVALAESAVGNTRTGAFVMVKVGSKNLPCLVPGGDKPSAELEAALVQNRLPVSATDKLRNCSVLAWVDLSRWQVVATDLSKGLGQATLVAVSPSGEKAVECELTSSKDRYDGLEGATTFLTLPVAESNNPATDPVAWSARVDLYTTGSSFGYTCTATVCNGYSIVGWGRVASTDALAVRLRMGNGPVYQVPVGPGGWFTFTWQSGPYKAGARPSIAAYDRQGRVVKTFR